MPKLAFINASSVRSLSCDFATPWTAACHHQLPELTQTYVHRVGDAIQSSHPLSNPSPPTFNLSQHQGLFPVSQFFASGGQRTGVSALASVLPMDIQDWFPLGWAGWISLLSKRLSTVFSWRSASVFPLYLLYFFFPVYPTNRILST